MVLYTNELTSNIRILPFFIGICHHAHVYSEHEKSNPQLIAGSFFSLQHATMVYIHQSQKFTSPNCDGKV